MEETISIILRVQIYFASFRLLLGAVISYLVSRLAWSFRLYILTFPFVTLFASKPDYALPVIIAITYTVLLHKLRSRQPQDDNLETLEIAARTVFDHFVTVLVWLGVVVTIHLDTSPLAFKRVFRIFTTVRRQTSQN